MNGSMLGNVAEISMGQSPIGHTCNDSGTGLPLLNGPTEFGAHHPEPTQYTIDPKKFAEPGDLLFCVRGSTTGRMNWADRRYAIGRGVASLRHSRGQDFQPWLRAVIEWQLPDILARSTGSTFPNISGEQLRRIFAPEHTATEQRAIAAVLGALDDKIELNRRMSATLEAMARALYRSWFVDFDPVHARARGDAPAHMDPATAALFPDRFGEAGLPEGWRIGSLDEVVAFNPRESLEKGSIAPYLDMKALPAAGMISDTPYPRPLGSGMKFRARDTLLARITPCLESGKTALVGDLVGHEVGWGSTEFIVMRAKGGIPASFPYCLARNDEFREQAIRSMAGSSGRQRADAKTLAALHTPIASSDVYEAFGQMTRPLVERALAMGRENQSLAELRDALLPKLMSGELRVRDAEAQVGAVA